MESTTQMSTALPRATVSLAFLLTGLQAKMKEELPAYRAAVAMIKPLEEREDAEGYDTFDMEAWWNSQRGDLRALASVLRAVLCHVPNSFPPERAFSILNDCMDDGQYNAFADYNEAMVNGPV
jgi:hypothetical protein